MINQKKRGPKLTGDKKRVIVSISVAPETADKLRELAKEHGSFGRAIEYLLK
jgi:hypothetical protein